MVQVSWAQRLFAAAGLLALAACSGGDTGGVTPTSANDNPSETAVIQSGQSSPEVRTVPAEASEYFDTSSPQMWVDWGSYAVVATVIDELEVPVAPITGTVEDPIEQASNRDLRLAIGSIEWKHPGAVQPLAEGQEIQVRFYDGWVEQDGERLPLVYSGHVRPEPGHRYLMVLSEGSEDSPDDFTVQSGSVQPVEDEVVAWAESEFDGQSPPQVGEALAELKPDPETAPVAGEDLQDRIIRVLDIYGD